MLVESEQCSEEMFTLPRMGDEYKVRRRASSVARRHALEYHQAPEKSEQQRSEEVFNMSRLANGF